MGSLILVGTIVGGVALAVVAARWSLLLIVHNMPERKRN